MSRGSWVGLLVGLLFMVVAARRAVLEALPGIARLGPAGIVETDSITLKNTREGVKWSDWRK